MLKFIRNSKSKGVTEVKGITFHKGNGKPYIAQLSMYNSKTKKMTHYFIGSFKTLKESKKARVKFILELL